MRLQEKRNPTPRARYLLSFGNGYGCFPYEIEGDQLALNVRGSGYRGPVRFVFPKQVEVLGKIKIAAFALPPPRMHGEAFIPEPNTRQARAPWVLPSLGELFASQAYFLRSTFDNDSQSIGPVEGARPFVSQRTLRRYRQPIWATNSGM